MNCKKALLVLLLLVIAVMVYSVPQVRIKDISYLKGVRDNQLTGIGIVTGLTGKGDSSSSVMLQESVSNMLAHFGVNISPDDIKSKNCAIVMVTMELPSFVGPGDRVDVIVSSIGDARSLEGGVLLQTNLQAANSRVYAVAQGKVFIPTRNSTVKTVGSIASGAIVEQEVLTRYLNGRIIEVVLRNPDFVTADKLKSVVLSAFPDISVLTNHAASVSVEIPQDRMNDPVAFIAELEALTLEPDVSGKVVIDSETEVIIVGENVKIGKVAVSYKQIDMSVGSSLLGDEETPEQFVLDETVNVEDFVNLLKKVGVKTDVIIGILKAVERSGALYGSLIVM
ncbi:MAG: flagellar basal body P-ring protein FlgI [Spirochaetales bacterium]|nr:flagellar basal body P-ring protein FlgI [Spirochaetales bacterium]